MNKPEMVDANEAKTFRNAQRQYPLMEILILDRASEFLKGNRNVLPVCAAKDYPTGDEHPVLPSCFLPDNRSKLPAALHDSIRLIRAGFRKVKIQPNGLLYKNSMVSVNCQIGANV